MSEAGSVLVLDDEPIVVDRVKTVLEREGFEVETFTDSLSALRRLAERTFAVVVTDIKMRGPSGMDVVKWVAQSAPDTRTIVITGYATQDTHDQARALGAYAFIAKPFKLKEIARLVRQAYEGA